MKYSHPFLYSTFFFLFLVAAHALMVSGFVAAADQQGRTASDAFTEAPAAGENTVEPLYPSWWGKPPRMPPLVACKEPGKCVSCHESNAAMDPSHAISCSRCHGGDPTAEEKDSAHTGLIADPGDLDHVDKTCGQCHAEQTRRVKRSPMALAPRMINQTRFAFGAQHTPAPLHGTVDVEGLPQVPHPSRSGNLADDLLRRSCLRCHLNTKGSSRWGEHRGRGCTACHSPYPNSRDGKPRVHALVRNGGVTACLKCHNSNHVGADFVGLYEKDSHRGFRSPFVDGRQAPRIYGSEQHRLAPDIHFRAGMSCTDCHILDEVHGTGEPPASAAPGVKISCEGCHVRGDHPAISADADGRRILTGYQSREVPVWNPLLIPHGVDAHRNRLRCSSCHAAWSFQDYGFHLMLEERADYWKWAPTAAQNDPQVQDLLTRNVGTFAELVPPAGSPIPEKPESQWELPTMRDWLTGERRAGAWFRGYTDRSWSRPPLGLDEKGRIAVMRPIHQYVLSHVGPDAGLLLDRIIPITGAGSPALVCNPYGPHTISAKGRACHECHGNPKAAGFGEAMKGIEKPGIYPVWRPESQIPGHSFRWDALLGEHSQPTHTSTRPGAGPLDRNTLERLLNPSPRHRLMWYRYLKGQGINRP
jgi:hypothetical protein